MDTIARSSRLRVRMVEGAIAEALPEPVRRPPGRPPAEPIIIKRPPRPPETPEVDRSPDDDEESPEIEVPPAIIPEMPPPPGPGERASRRWQRVAFDRPVLVTPEQARRVMEVYLAADLSAERNQSIPLPLNRDRAALRSGG